MAAEFDLLAQLIAATSLGGSSLVSYVQGALSLAAWSSCTSLQAGVSAEHSTMLLSRGRPGALCCQEMCSNCTAEGTCASASWLSYCHIAEGSSWAGHIHKPVGKRGGGGGVL